MGEGVGVGVAIADSWIKLLSKLLLLARYHRHIYVCVLYLVYLYILLDMCMLLKSSHPCDLLCNIVLGELKWFWTIKGFILHQQRTCVFERFGLG